MSTPSRRHPHCQLLMRMVWLTAAGDTERSFCRVPANVSGKEADLLNDFDKVRRLGTNISVTERLFQVHCSRLDVLGFLE
uniref:Putative secreted protein n=1 Tax=Ixodes scapularis TaxID=6945 RepID=A0A4D5RYX9_IXOSC